VAGFRGCRRRRLVGDPRKRNSSRGFNLGLAWEKESEEGNASTGLRRSAGGWGRQATARCGGEAPASNRARGRTGNIGEEGPVRILTPRRSSGSSEEAAVTAVEMRRQRWR
jgi:hypothetical protein